jgi:hypothetical protein
VAFIGKPDGIGVYLGYSFALIIHILSALGSVVKDAYMINGYLYHEMEPWMGILMGILLPVELITMWMLVLILPWGCP